MAKKQTKSTEKSIEDMSAAELRALADKIEKEEKERKAAEYRNEITKLRNERRALIAAHNKAIAAIDRKIKRLGGKTGGVSRRPKNSGLSSQIMEIIRAAGKPLSTSEIKSALEENGTPAINVNQTLAYLKNQGKLFQPERTYYQIK